MGRKKHKNKKAVSTLPRPETAQSAGLSKSPTVASSPKSTVAARPSGNLELGKGWFYGSLIGLVLLTAWAYWPTLVWMESQWRTQADYSHGYLIVPLALLLLWHRRDAFPGVAQQVSWAGLLLLGLAIAGRVVGRVVYADFLDAWTLMLWVGGVVWILCGWRTFVWSLPAVAFLILLSPLPYSAESLLSYKLQSVATNLSVAVLQTLGLPALAEGHTIWLGEQQMLVEEACSGLRIFVGMGALGYVFATLARRAWVDKWVILASALPIAILVNAFRVICTVMAFHWMPPTAAKTAHDFFGVVMIVMGAVLLSGVKWYWEHLYRPLDSTLDLRRMAMDGFSG